jgi:hypothetical protein
LILFIVNLLRYLSQERDLALIKTSEMSKPYINNSDYKNFLEHDNIFKLCCDLGLDVNFYAVYATLRRNGLFSFRFYPSLNTYSSNVLPPLLSVYKPSPIFKKSQITITDVFSVNAVLPDFIVFVVRFYILCMIVILFSSAESFPQDSFFFSILSLFNHSVSSSSSSSSFPQLCAGVVCFGEVSFLGILCEFPMIKSEKKENINYFENIIDSDNLRKGKRKKEKDEGVYDLNSSNTKKRRIDESEEIEEIKILEKIKYEETKNEEEKKKKIENENVNENNVKFINIIKRKKKDNLFLHINDVCSDRLCFENV